MRSLVFAPAVGLVATVLAGPPAASQDTTPWADLLERDLKDWTRLGTGKSNWHLTADRTLACAAATDAYAPDTEFRDGTLRFEYRFRPTGKKAGYRASVSVRRTEASPGCKLALGDECGRLSGTFVASSDRAKTIETRPAEPLGRAAGRWNLVRIQMEGRSVAVSINGRPAGSFDRCDGDRGLVVFEAEGSEIEFRHILWKPAR